MGPALRRYDLSFLNVSRIPRAAATAGLLVAAMLPASTAGLVARAADAGPAATAGLGGPHLMAPLQIDVPTKHCLLSCPGSSTVPDLAYLRANAPVQTNSELTVTLGVTNDARFFRLRR